MSEFIIVNKKLRKVTGDCTACPFDNQYSMVYEVILGRQIIRLCNRCWKELVFKMKLLIFNN